MFLDLEAFLVVFLGLEYFLALDLFCDLDLLLLLLLIEVVSFGKWHAYFYKARLSYSFAGASGLILISFLFVSHTFSLLVLVSCVFEFPITSPIGFVIVFLP